MSSTSGSWRPTRTRRRRYNNFGSNLGCHGTPYSAGEINRIVYEGELYPHELVLVLHRRSRMAQHAWVLSPTVHKIMLLGILTDTVMSFLIPKRFILTSDYLTRQMVARGQVLLTLRRWFWAYGRLPVPRSLRMLVVIEPAHCLVVKAEPADDPMCELAELQ